MLEVVFVGDKAANYPKVLQARIEINETPEVYDARLALVTDDPFEALAYVSHHYLDEFLLLLDLRIKGALEVAKKVREKAKFILIVLLGVDEKLLKSAVEQMIEPFAVLEVKDDAENEIEKLRVIMDVAYQRYIKYFNDRLEESITCRDIEGTFRRIKLEQILWAQNVTGKSRHIILHGKNELELELLTDLKKLEEKSIQFFRSSRGILINLQNATKFDPHEQLIYFTETTEPVRVSGRKTRELVRRLL